MNALLLKDEDARLSALREYRILDTAPEDAYDDVTRLAAFACGTPIAAISFIDAHRQWFKSTLNLRATEMPREVAFCAYTILRSDILIIQDTQEDLRFSDNPLVTGDPHICFYAGMPLISDEGYALGSLCVMDYVPRRLMSDQETALRALARLVTRQLETRRRAAAQERLLGEANRAQEILALSTRRLREAQRVAQIGSWEFDIPAMRLTWSDEMYRLFEFDPLLGEPTFDAMRARYHPEDLPLHTATIERAIQNGEPYELDIRILRRDGSLRWIHSRGEAARDAEGNVTRFLGTAMDISERKANEIEKRRAEDALKMSERRYRRLFETAHDGILILDAETGRITSANPFMERLLDYTQAEFLGKELWEIGLLRDREASQEAFRVLQQEGSVRYEDLPLETRGGERREVEFVSNIYRENGHSVIQCNIRDIAYRKAAEVALRQSEARLRLALESGLLGSYEMDFVTGEFLAVSNTYKAHFGLLPDAEFSLGTLFKMIHPDDRSLVREVVTQASEERRGFQAEHRLIWPDGSLHWISAHGTLLYDESGGAPHLIGVTQEITARKRQEAEREQALAEALEQADHDPLTGLFNHRVFHNRLDTEATRASLESTTLGVVMLDLDNSKFFNDVYGHAAGDEVLRLVADRLKSACRSYDVLARFGGDEFALLLPNVGRLTVGEVEARLHASLQGLSYRANEQEALIPIMVSLGSALFSEASADASEASADYHAVLHQADERLRWTKTGGVEEAARIVRSDASTHVQGFSMLDALVTAVDNKDRYTRRHSEDVMEYSLMIVRELGLGEGEQHMVAVAALLHDVGKIGVPDAILRKPGKLTGEEFEAIKQHPQMGAVMVGAVPGLEGTLDAVRHHHERWDGEGYPFGLKGEQTPLVARLMAVADAFSAMTTDRPYRQGMEREKAIFILSEGAGSQWDPLCVGAFLRALPVHFPETPVD
ncbi:MAG: PAS domain S-box protein [Janthinobacterium lividum]